MLKHHGKKEVLRLIDEMEEEYDWPFRFNPEAVHAERATRSASAVEPGQWGCGINVYGKRRRYQAKPSKKSTLNAAMYRFWSDEEYNRVQAYLRTHENYQLEAVSPCFILLARRSSFGVVTSLVFMCVLLITITVTSTAY